MARQDQSRVQTLRDENSFSRSDFMEVGRERSAESSGQIKTPAMAFSEFDSRSAFFPVHNAHHVEVKKL
jgi:hypothetical protein